MNQMPGGNISVTFDLGPLARRVFAADMIDTLEVLQSFIDLPSQEWILSPWLWVNLGPGLSWKLRDPNKRISFCLQPERVLSSSEIEYADLLLNILGTDLEIGIAGGVAQIAVLWRVPKEESEADSLSRDS